MHAHRLAAALGLAALACGGEPAAPEVIPVDEPAARDEPDPPAALPAPSGPWAVRYIRACAEWSHSTLLATDRHLFACDGSVFELASGRLVRARGAFELPLAAVGERSVWSSLEVDAIVIRDVALGATRVEGPGYARSAARTLDGRGVMLAGDPVRVVSLDDGAVRDVPDAARCADTEPIGFTHGGAVACVRSDGARSVLVTVGRAEEAVLPTIADARFDPRGGGLVVRSPDAVHFVDESGRVLASRAIDSEARLLDVGPDGSALIALEDRTERWWRDGTEVAVEAVYARAADDGVLAGARIALARHGQLVWLERGATRALPAIDAPAPPPGWRALEANEGEWNGEGRAYPRDPGDLAAFTSDHGFLRVGASDSDELAGLDDEAWARATMGRYVERGTDRWARTWRDGAQRVLRGHSYIGGCERTHVDVLVRERDGWLERRIAYTARGAGDALGVVPGDARSVDDGYEDRYAGDPSTGPID